MADTNGKVRNSGVRLDSKRLARNRKRGYVRDIVDSPVRLNGMLSTSRFNKIRGDIYRRINGVQIPDDEPLTTGEIISMIQEIEQSREVIPPLLSLLREADASVTFVGVSPDPRLRTQEVSITVSNEETNWESVAFRAVSYGQCLLAAAEKFSEKPVGGSQ